MEMDKRIEQAEREITLRSDFEALERQAYEEEKRNAELAYQEFIKSEREKKIVDMLSDVVDYKIGEELYKNYITGPLNKCTYDGEINRSLSEELRCQEIVQLAKYIETKKKIK